MIRRSLTLFIAALALACSSSTNHDPRAPDTSPRTRYSGLEVGASTVGAIPDVLLRDNERNKDITLSVDYPTRGGPHPLIVLSPAGVLTNREYVGLSSYWAANDYVVIRVAHPDARGDRARDLRFVLDSLDALEQRYPELQGKIDRTRIGAAGHEEGGQTAMELAADPRIKAVIAMAPSGGPEVKGPTLFIVPAPVPPPVQPGTTTAAAVAPSEAPPPEVFARMPAGDKWAVIIEGARFQSFTGRLDDVTRAQARARANTGDPFNPNDNVMTRDGRVVNRADYAAIRQQDLFAIVRGSALAFWDAYLKSDAAGRTALEKLGDRRGTTLERK